MGIVQVSPSTTALDAQHYESFEMAKEFDSILGGEDLAGIRAYGAFARAQATAISKTIAAMGELADVAQAKKEMSETAATFAKVSVYADVRLGELLQELPKDRSFRGNQHKEANSDTQEVTKADAIADAGLSKSQAYDLQTMASHHDIVQETIDRAERDGLVVSRKQVLDAIKREQKAEEVKRAQSLIASEQGEGSARLFVGDSIGKTVDCDLLLTDPPYSTDVEDIDEFVDSWLFAALDGVKSTGFAYVFVGAYPDELRRISMPKCRDTSSSSKSLFGSTKTPWDRTQKDAISRTGRRASSIAGSTRRIWIVRSRTNSGRFKR